MESILTIGKLLVDNYQGIVAAIDALLLALVAVFVFIPGDQPEATIRKIADFVEKFSKKPQA